MPPSRNQDPASPRGPQRKTPPTLPSAAVLLVIAASALYGWWQNGNPPPAPQPGGAQQAPQADTTANSSPAPIITPTRRASESESTTRPEATSASEIQITPAKRSKSPQTKPQPPPNGTDRSRPTFIPQVTLRNQDGKVIYQGPIDLQPTLDRIEKGERADHRNDGTVFQNREGRLARKPSGYYHEYVVHTPNQRGPGPQRLILGQGGEVFYTADHYRSFRKIDVKVDIP